MVGDEFIPDIGGAPHYTLGLSTALAKLGVEPVLITHLHPGQAEEEEFRGVKVKRLRGFVLPRLNRAASVRIASTLHKVIKYGGFDVVHAQDIYSSMSWASLWSVHKRKIPSVVTCHTILEPTWRCRLIHRPILKFVSYANRVIGVSEASKEFCISLGIPSSKICVIQNGVDLSLFNPRLNGRKMRERLSLKDEPLIVTAIRLTKRKGPSRLVDAFSKVRKRFPNAKLAIAGEGSEVQNLLTQIKKLGIEDSATMMGPLPQEEVAQLMAAADVFVLPSTVESFSLVAIEAMAAGTPFIGPRSGNIPKIVKGGFNGLLVPPADNDAIAKMIIRVLSDKELGRYLSKNGLKVVQEKFSWEICARKTLELYEKVGKKQA
jgi:1,4-alpha-glucan branching enzyme